MKNPSLNCTQPCIIIEEGYFTINSPTFNITNISDKNIFILNGQNENYIYELVTGETVNLESTYFNSGIITLRFTAESYTNQLCLNVNPAQNSSGEIVFEVVDCGQSLPSTIITGNCSCGNYGCNSTNLYQDTTWIITIPIYKKDALVGLITPFAYIESSLGKPVTFEYYYKNTYGVDPPEMTFTLDQTNYRFIGNVSDYNIFSDGTGPDNLTMVVTAASGAKWVGNINCVDDTNLLDYTYTFYKNDPSKVELTVNKNPFVGVVNTDGGISNNENTYSSTFKNGSGSFVEINSDPYMDLGIFSTDTPFKNGGGISTDYYVGDSSVKTIAIRKNSNLIVGGQFNRYNLNPSSGLLILDSNGKYLPDFTLNLDKNAVVNTICDINDDSIFVGGEFTFTVPQCGYPISSPTSNTGTFTYYVEVTTEIGIIDFVANSYNIPDRFVVNWNGVDVIDTGFVGSPEYNYQLNFFGYPNVVSSGIINTSFIKSAPTPAFVTVTIFSPLTGTNWNFTVSCPSPLPTPTPTPTQSSLCQISGASTLAIFAEYPIYVHHNYNYAYSSLGTIFHSPYNLDGTSPDNIYLAILTTPVVWKRTSMFNGPLNRTGLWSDYAPLNTWLGFSKCITVQETKTYWIGMAGDNAFRFVVDGTTFVDTNGGPLDYDVCVCNTSFQYWHVYPITLTAGNHVIELYGLNHHLIGVFGCEIYDNTFEELSGATSISDLNIIFTTTGFGLFTVVQNLSEQYITASGLTCESGYTLCGQLCTTYDCVPYPSSTPNSTPTPTLTPTPSLYSACICYKFTNTNSIVEDLLYVDCSNSTKLVRFKGSRRLCVKQIISISPYINYVTSGNCVNNKCLIGQAPPQHIVKINKQGQIDSSFLKNMGEGFDSPVNVIVSYINNTIIVGGNFTTYAGLPVRGIVRLNLDGTINFDYKGGFNINGDTPNVTDIKVLSDNSIIVFGGGDSSNWLTDYQGVGIATNIVKLTPNGNRDNSFAIGGGFDGGVNSSTIQNDNKIVVVGDFDCYDDDNNNYCGLDYIVRINSDGSYDSTFDMSTGFNDYVNKVIQLTTGELVTGGQYNSPTSKLTKLLSGGIYNLYNFISCDGITGYTYGPPNISNGTVVSANINDSSLVCGTITGPATTGSSEVYYTNAAQTYSSCTDCVTIYQVRLLMRIDGRPDTVITKTMTKAQIDKVLSDGPIFSTGAIETYEILDYWIGSSKPKPGSISFVDITPTPTVTKTKTPTPTVTKTKTPTPTVTQTKTPTPTTTKTPTPSITPNYVAPSQTPTKTKTGTPMATPTPTGTLNCCKTCTLFNGTAANNITYMIRECDNTIKYVTVPFYNSVTRCCISAMFVSGTTNYYPNPTGITYSNDCSCSTVTPTVTPTKTKTPTVTTTKTKTPMVTPTKTKTPTPTKTKTPTPTSSGITSNIIFIDVFYKKDDVLGIVTRTPHYQYCSLTSGGTDVYGSNFAYSNTISQLTGTTTTFNSIIYDNVNDKIFVGNYTKQTVDSYDFGSSILTTINTSEESFAMSIDTNNNLLGVLNGFQSPNTKVSVIDTITNSFNGTINGLVAGFKGDITTDNNGYMYIVGNSDKIQVVDTVSLVTADTISLTVSADSYSKIIYNSINNYLYVLTDGKSLEFITTGGTGGTISISGYSGINQTMAFNPDKNFIYIGNIDSSGEFGIISINCTTNTIAKFWDKLRFTYDTINPQQAILHYDTLSKELFLINVKTEYIFRFTT